jgi:3',5'-cyclic AMP phosphodiesterase CpdA
MIYGDNRYKHPSPTFDRDHRDVACLGILRRGCLFEGEIDGQKVNDYPAFILHSGDLVCEGGDALKWIPHFFRPAGALLSRVPCFPCLGNHEYYNTSGQYDEAARAKYIQLFTLPANERWYSFDYGKCHFICLDTNQASYFNDDSDAQWKWLIESDAGAEDGDLPTAHQAKVSGAVKRIFVLFHEPPYSSGTHYGEAQCRMIQARLVPEFEQYDVDMVFSGHDHFYERARKGGVHYVVTGGGGAPRRNAISPCPYEEEHTGAVQRALYAGEDRPGHYCVVTVHAQTGHLEFRAYTEDQQRIDGFTLK